MFDIMEEPVCSIEIKKVSNKFKAKIQSNTGRYVEIVNDDFEYLLDMVYEDISSEVMTY